MKKKKIIIISSLVVVTGLLVLVVALSNKNSVQGNVSNLLNKDKCDEVNKNYSIKFDTNSDVKIEDIKTCFDCKDDKNLPVPEREGYDFDGWYYDKGLTLKVDKTSIKDLSVKDKKKDKCVIGYEDIVLYAKWNEKPKEEEQSVEEYEPEDTYEEVLEDIEYVEPEITDEETVEVDESSLDTDINGCEIKKPVESGRYKFRTGGYTPFSTFYIMTEPRTNIYSITCGVVYHVRTYTSHFQDMPVSDIYILVRDGDKTMTIVYLEVASVQVNAGSTVTNDTVLGTAAIRSHDVFNPSHNPYINLYAQKGQLSPFERPNRSHPIINIGELLQVHPNEAWETR